jgi:hypothetical protein
MTRIEKLEQDIRNLNPEELAALRDWFRIYDAAEWDRQFEKDARNGKLDRLAEEALAAHKTGRTRSL